MGGCWVSIVTNWSCVIKTGLLIKTWKLLLPDDFSVPHDLTWTCYLSFVGRKLLKAAL